MKKILFFGFILTLVFTVSASAQVADGKRHHEQREMRSFNDRDGNRYESRHFHNDEFRYKMARRRAYRDGRISNYERRHLNKMRRHELREHRRFRHHSFHHHAI
jgi:hypothetical protein